MQVFMQRALTVTLLCAALGCGDTGVLKASDITETPSDTQARGSLDTGAQTPADVGTVPATDIGPEVMSDSGENQTPDVATDTGGQEPLDTAVSLEVGPDNGASTCHTYATSIQTIFNQHCVGCHNVPDTDNSLNLIQGQSLNSLMTTKSQWGPDLKMVVPFDSENSFIMDKMSPGPSFGLIMPIKGPAGGPAMPELRALIGQWIDAGANLEPFGCP